MTSRFVRLCLALLVPALASNLSAQQPPPATPLPQTPPAPAAAQEEMVQIKIPDADLDTVLSALEIYTGKIILRPAALPTTTYNLKIDRPIPKSAAIRYIETVLAMNNIGVVQLDEHALKIVPLPTARTEAPEIISGSAFQYPPSGKVAAKLFQLEFLRVQEFTQMLQPILGPNFGGPVLLPNANAVLITDSMTNLQRVEILLQQVDRPMTAGMKPKFYPVKHATASDLVAKLRGILTGTLQLQLGSATSFSADDRSNQIILVTDPRQYEFFDELIARLDVQADPNIRHDVVYLNHAKAEEVVTVLNQLIRGQTMVAQRQGAQSVRPGQGLPQQPGQPQLQPGAQPGAVQPPATPPPIASGIGTLDGLASNEFSSIMTVVEDRRSNSVVVSGTVDDIRLLRELIEKLDRVLAQVRIEVVIAEVTLDDNDQTGIGALGLIIEGDKVVGFSGSGGPSGIPVSVVGSLARPNGENLVTGRWDLAAEIAIGTTPRKSNTTIISTPAIVTSHGKESEIFSGETRPVVTGSIISGTVGGTTQTTTQLRIGTRLNVTPFIGADGSVQLQLKQTVEDVTSEIIIDNNPQPIIGTRETTSYVTAMSGEVIVLGGFQKKIDLKTTSRLGPIPIIGDLFGPRRKQNFRQELLFFLRPVVLTNNPAIDNRETLDRVEELPMRDDIKRQLDPTYEPPPIKGSVIDRILPR